MNKQNVKHFLYGLVLGAWTLFCICDLAELQEKQRLSVYAQEQAILAEISATQKETKVYTASKPVSDITYKPKEVEKEPVEVIDNLPKYTDPDLILLAQLIEAEGGIESYECKLYIGSVVLNRMMHDSFPDGLEDVIFQVSEDGVHQFSVTMVRKDGTRAIDCKPSEESLDAAAELLTHGTHLPHDVVVFYTENCKSDWLTTRETYTQVDHTIFAYAYKE